MPDAATIAPSPTAAPTPTGAAALGTVPLGFSNVPQGKGFKRASEALRSGKYDAPSSTDEKKVIPDPVVQNDQNKVEPVKDPTNKQPDGDQPAKGADESKDATDPNAAKPADGEKKKPSPWRLVDEWKGKYAALEKEVAQLRSTKPTEDPKVAEQVKQYNERITTLEKENTDLKDRMKFVNYAESDDYKEKFDRPYQEHWHTGREMVSSMLVTDAEGNSRQGTAQDFDRLMTEYLQNPAQAGKQISEMFGENAPLLTPYLANVKGAAVRASRAIEEFKKTGNEKLKQETEAQSRERLQTSEHLAKSWEKANKTALDDPKNGTFFKPKEGDQEWNQRLAKGFELADRAFKENPFAPGLTAEQRESIVNRHAAVRNRAAAFGPMKHRIQQLEAQLEEREKALAEYEEAEPGAGDAQGRNGGVVTNGGSALARATAALRSGKYARQ